MRKQILIFSVFMFISISSYGQFFTAPFIALTNGTEFCTSSRFNAELPHACLMSGNPMPVYDNMYVSYTWIAIHRNGSFTWNTHTSERAFPVPWEGEYSVKLLIKYIRKGRTTPFFVFRSNTLKFYGEHCE